MWFPMKQRQLDFTATAPCSIRNETDINALPTTVFDQLANDAWHEWFPEFKRLEWHTAAPHKVGSVRTVFLLGINLKEAFLAWEPGKRYTFRGDAISVPLASSFMEDIRLEPNSAGGTHVEWTVYYEPRLLMRLVHPLARAKFRWQFRRALANLKARSEKL